MPSPASEPTLVSAPFHGLVTILVDPGAVVGPGEVVAMLEAMKMEAPITAPRAGRVSAVTVDGPCQVVGGEVLLEIS